ncbi:MAG TPA: hypothetical protein VIS76_14915 [Pseudomonadales bacterium]
MKGKFIWALPSLIAILGGCTNVIVRDSSGSTLPVLSNAQISSAGLSGVKDNVYIVFEGKCPINAVPVLPQCGESLGSAVCRRAGEQVKFTPLPDPTEPNPEFGIRFDTQPDFNPCENNLGTVNPGVKNCKVVGETGWPGNGEADLLLKYTILSEDNACNLDPYLVLRR